MMLATENSLALCSVRKRSRLDLSFSNGTISSLTSFVRASAATRTNASGLIESVGVNAPRFGYDPVALTLKGLLLEPQRTNLLFYSSLAVGSGWYAEASGAMTTSALLGPDGSYATQLAGTGLAATELERMTSVSLTSGTTYTGSVFAKQGTTRYAFLRLTDSSKTFGALFDLQAGTYLGALSTGSALSGYAITPAGNGWYRLSASFVSTVTASTSYSCRPGITDSSSLNFLTTTASGYAYFFGAQLEAGSSVSSYIPTTSAAATRAVDQLSFVIPSGAGDLRYVFDDNSTQDVSVSAGAYTVPTNLNRQCIKRIYSP